MSGDSKFSNGKIINLHIDSGEDGGLFDFELEFYKEQNKTIIHLLCPDEKDILRKNYMLIENINGKIPDNLYYHLIHGLFTFHVSLDNGDEYFRFIKCRKKSFRLYIYNYIYRLYVMSSNTEYFRLN